MAGASADVGTGASDVGYFDTLLLSVNPDLQAGGYPEVWTQFSATLSAIPPGITGRIGFRYFVTEAGPNGSNSDHIGIDTVEFSNEPPFDPPWLSEDPTEGYVLPGESARWSTWPLTPAGWPPANTRVNCWSSAMTPKSQRPPCR